MKTHDTRCGRCGKTLTDPISVAAGAGPICRMKGKEEIAGNKTRSLFSPDFDIQVVDGVVVIYDLAQGGTSVTNAAAEVIEAVSQRLGNLAGRTVIYRDTMKIFDGIAIDQHGRFEGFYPIGTPIVESALKKAKALLARH